MTRHPSTEGNDLEPARVDAKEDVTVPDDAGGRVSLKGIEVESVTEHEARRIALIYAVAL